MALPKNSPFECPTLICSTCGKQMGFRIKKAGKGMIEELIYFCIGCRFEHVRSATYSRGTERPIRSVEDRHPEAASA